MIDFAAKNPQVDPDNVARRERYKQFKRLFKGDHMAALQDLIGRVPEGKRDLIYIAVNLAGLISRKCADFLFGEAPIIKGANKKDTQTLKNLATMLNLETALYEAGLTQSSAGDLVLRLRVADKKLILEEIPAGNYYADTAACNVREVRGEAVAYPVAVEEKKYLRVEHHELGKLTHEAWALNTVGKVTRRVPLSVTDEQAPEGEVNGKIVTEETKVQRRLLWLVPNLRCGTDYWSISDYYDLVTLFDALNNRLSSIDRILGRHSNPKLVMPGQIVTGDLDSRQDLLTTQSAEDAKAIGYVTWDGQLVAAFTQLEKLVDFILWLAEIAPSLLGLDKSGAPESGKALRLRFIATEHKINRKKRYFAPILKEILVTAAELGAAWGVEGISKLSAEPTIEWQDGLPKIFSEMVEDLTALKAEGLVSSETAIMLLFDKTKEEAAAEIALIKKEREEAAAVALEQFENSGGKSKDDAPPRPEADD